MTEDISRSETRVVGFEDPELDFQLLRQLGLVELVGKGHGARWVLTGAPPSPARV